MSLVKYKKDNVLSRAKYIAPTNPIAFAYDASLWAAKKAYKLATDDRANRKAGRAYTIGSRPMVASTRPTIGSRPSTSVPNKVGYQASTKGKNVKTVASKKLPKVSKDFRKKVESALMPANVVSHYNCSWHGTLQNINPANFNNQRCARDWFDGFQNTLGAAEGAGFFDLFTPERVVDQASRLFNGKTGAPQRWAGVATGNFTLDGLEIRVVNQYVTYKLRNNTGQSKEVDFYFCTPKTNQTDNPFASFVASLGQDVTDGKILNSSISVDTFGVTPGLTTNFKNNWKYVKKEVALAPGASTQFTIPGPKNFLYQWDKFKDPNLGVTDISYPKHIPVLGFYIVRNPDLLECTNAGGTVQTVTGHLQGAVVTNQTSITIEMKYVASIMAPEVTTDALKTEKTLFEHFTNLSVGTSTPVTIIRQCPETNDLDTSAVTPM